MPPKIGVMPKHLTFLLDGEDELDHESAQFAAHGLPHELYLLGQSFALGAALAGKQALGQDELICIEPIHLHATRDHLVLLQLDAFNIAADDLKQLMNEASAVFMDEGLGPLTQVTPFQWLGKTEFFKTLHTHSAAQAQGRNIDWWLPKDTKELGLAKRWRRIQNEVQMRWHIHPINQAREEQGLPTVNSIWLSGIGNQADLQFASELNGAQQIISDKPWMPKLAENLNIPLIDTWPSQTELLANTNFIWHSQAKDIWSSISRLLMEDDLEVELIDFKKSLRKRRFRSADFRTHPLAFWRKAQPPSWEELIA